MTKSRKLAYLALITAAFIWGIAPPVIKYTLKFISPIQFLFYRFLIASLVVAIPTILRIKKIKPTLKEWRTYLFLGFLCTPLNLLLLFLGINKTSAIDASLISITAPIFVAIGGIIFLKEHVNRKELLGLGVAVIGTFLTIFQPLFESKSDFSANLEGNFLVFLGTLVWVGFILLAKKQRHLDPFLLSSFSFFVGLVVFVPLALPSLTTHYSLFTTNAIWGVLFMAIFSSVIAYFTHLYGLSKIEASEAEVFTYLQPIFTVPVAIFFLHEKISVPFLTGVFFIVLGVSISEFLRKRRT